MTVGVLVSYADEAARVLMDDLVSGPLVWDSGAFSVFMGKAEITVEQHAAWVVEQQRRRTESRRFVALDVIGDPEGTFENYVAQRALGAVVEPTIHYGEPLEQVDRLISVADTEWFNIGGLVPFRRDRSHRRNIGAFVAAVRRRLPPEVRIHALGCSNPNILRLAPIDAADSSSWISTDKFGKLTLFDDHLGVWRTFQVLCKTQRAKREAWEIAHRNAGWLRQSYGISPRDLTDTDDRVFLLKLSVLGTERFADWITRRHGREFVFYRVSSVSYERRLVSK